MQGDATWPTDLLWGSARCFERKEEKYELDDDATARLEEEILAHLPLFEYSQGQPFTYITTAYFDTRERELYQRAERDYDDNVKLRVKEYYYPRSPVEAAPNPTQAHFPGRNGSAVAPPAYVIQPHCYVEIKQRVGGYVLKKRFGVPKSSLSRLFAGEDCWPILQRIGPCAGMGPLKDVYAEFRRYLERYRVEVTSIVNYRRRVYQEDESDLRITFDDRLMVFAPVPELYEGREALTPEGLGPAIRSSDRVILEIKCPASLPSWLERVLRVHSTRKLSKFTTSVRCLLSHSASPPASRAPGLPSSN